MPERLSNRERDRAFFNSKKPWSVQKDQILANYLAAYLKKILYRRQSATLPGQPVLIVDAFAGKGWFEDGNPGSPVHIIEAADEVAQGRYRVVLGNEDPEQHAFLERALARYDHAKPLLWDSRRMLRSVLKNVGDRALFVFIDPFGITGYEFDLIKPLIGRVRDGLSTELLINFAVPDFHRESARDSVLARGIGALDTNTQSKIENLDAALGGNWWREFQYDPDLNTDERSALVIDGYVSRLKDAGFQYVGHCPIRQREGDSEVYRLIHGSRHVEALKLMNETMGRVLTAAMHENVKEDAPLFGELVGDPEFMEWERGRQQAKGDLRAMVPEVVAQIGHGPSRERVWERLVEDHFLQFLRSEYLDIVKSLVKNGVLRFERTDGGKRLNDNARLFLV